MRKRIGLSLAVVGACGFVASKASAQILAGNTWPNPTLSTAAAPGPDPADDYPGSPPGYGDTNPRPDGWHRGGVDFGNTTPPIMDLWTPVEGSTVNTPPSGYSLEINDNDTSNYGEWFSDYNPLPAASIGTGAPFELQFFWEYTNVASTARPESSDQFRVSVRWGNASSSIYTGDLGGGPDEIIPAGSSDVTTWTQVDELLTPPVGATTMSITVDSGGSSAATGQIWVDDISTATVPEPASIGLLTAGTMFLFSRRRRRS